MTSACNLICQLLVLVKSLKCTATYRAHPNAVHQTVVVPSLSVCTCNMTEICCCCKQEHITPDTGLSARKGPENKRTRKCLVLASASASTHYGVGKFEKTSLAVAVCMHELRVKKTLINYRLFHTIIDYEKTISTTPVFTYLGVFC